MAHTQRKIVTLVCIALLISTGTVHASISTNRPKGLLSWEVSKNHRKFMSYRGQLKSERRFDVVRGRAIRLAKNSLFNRRPYQFSSPVLSNKVIFVGVDAGEFYAVDVNGVPRKRWTVKTHGGINAAASVAGDLVYVGDLRGNAYAFDVHTGETRWQAPLDDVILAAPAVADDHVYFVTQSGRIYALDALSGVETWHTDSVEKNVGFSVRRAGAPLVFNGRIYVGTNTGMVIAYDQRDGHIHWVRQLGDMRQQVYDVDTTALIYEDKLYIASADGGLFQLNPADGRVLWSADVGGPNDVLVFNDVLYASSQGVLSAVDPQTGATLWQQDFEEPSISAPVAGKDFIAVVATTDKMYLVDPKTGDVMYDRYVRKGSFGDPVVAGNMIHVLSNSSRLFTFRAHETTPYKMMTSSAQ